MHYPPLISTIFLRLSAFLLLRSYACALKNVTVNDQDPSIVYTPPGSWARITDSSTVIFDTSGEHMLTSDPAATAAFNFTGVAIYFLSARWPYSVNTSVKLDNGDPVLLDLVDHTRPDAGGGPATVKSQVVAKAVGLKNVTHRVTVAVGQGQLFALVDALTYTTLAPGESDPHAAATPPDQFTPVPPSNSTTSSNSSKSKSKATKLAIGLAILGVIILLLIIFAVWFYYRRKEKRTQPPERRIYALHDPPVGGSDPRDMRRAYRDEETDEKDGLRVANPDPAPGSPASDTSTVHVQGMTGVGTRNAGIAMPSPHAASERYPSHYGHSQDQRDENPDHQGQRLQSPGRFYGVLREMSHSPTRAYPVRDGRVSGRETIPSATSVSLYTDSQGHRSGAYSGGIDDNGMLVPPRGYGQGRERASGIAVDSQGVDRRTYPEAPLAYVPVFKQ